MGRFALPLLLGLGIASCSGRSVPHPAYVPQPTSALAVVPYPPPPGRVEYIPPRTNDDSVWIDGEWIWQGRRWTWRRGRWVVPVKGTFFSPWAQARGADGTVYVAPGTWRDAKGAGVAAPEIIAEAEVLRGGVVSAEGDVEQGGLESTDRTRDGGARRSARDVGLMQAGVKEAGASPSDEGAP